MLLQCANLYVCRNWSFKYKIQYEIVFSGLGSLRDRLCRFAKVNQDLTTQLSINITGSLTPNFARTSVFSHDYVCTTRLPLMWPLHWWLYVQPDYLWCDPYTDDDYICTQRWPLMWPLHWWWLYMYTGMAFDMTPTLMMTIYVHSDGLWCDLYTGVFSHMWLCMYNQKSFDITPTLMMTMYVQPDDLWCDPYTDDDYVCLARRSLMWPLHWWLLCMYIEMAFDVTSTLVYFATCDYVCTTRSPLAWPLHWWWLCMYSQMTFDVTPTVMMTMYIQPDDLWHDPYTDDDYVCLARRNLMWSLHHLLHWCI